MNSRRKTSSLALCALFTALLALCAQIQLPLPGVPVNLALFAVHLGAMLLSPRETVSFVLAYLLLGTFGVPVFSGFRSGPAVLAGPTGGFLAGYLLCAPVVCRLSRGADSTAKLFFSALTGTALCSACGFFWFMHATESAFSASLAAYFLIFLPGDLVKIMLAILLFRRLEKPLRAITA